MKRNLITIMLCLTAICAGSQTFIQVPIPGRTNQWWTNSPPQTSVVGWEAWAAQNENSAREHHEHAALVCHKLCRV